MFRSVHEIKRYRCKKVQKKYHYGVELEADEQINVQKDGWPRNASHRESKRTASENSNGPKHVPVQGRMGTNGARKKAGSR
mmetsp:Transcript_31637/g.72479  ORF Transcript_31637/g.72479 Transcript_31637/m.72479 type:complete len:81 (+) Transcript_31637:200-442(+)